MNQPTNGPKLDWGIIVVGLAIAATILVFFGLIILPGLNTPQDYLFPAVVCIVLPLVITAGLWLKNRHRPNGSE